MNPFLRDWKLPIPFDAIEVAHVREAVAQTERNCQAVRAAILASPPEDVSGRLWKMDELEATLDYAHSPLYLMKDVHPDDAIRDACHEAVEQLTNLETQYDYDEDLFRSLEQFSAHARELSPTEQRYLKIRMDQFMRNGFKLSGDDRRALLELDEKLNQLELQFSRNIAEGEVSLTFSDAEIQGLPDDFKQEHREADGTYRVSTQYPDYYPFMRYCHDEAARKRLYEAFQTRAASENLPILRQLLELRSARGQMLGFSTYAAYKLDDKMAKNPGNVWSFLADVRGRVLEKARQDYAALCREQGSEPLQPWSKAYVTNLFKANHFELSEEDVKVYFPLEQTLQGLFNICETLFGVQFRKASLPVWHADVRAFEVYEADRQLGRFYLDLFPRPKKYGHAACFGVQAGRRLGNDYVMPTATLVCNFPTPGADRPSLLTHDEVETLFHEFGHLLHQLLTQSPFYRFAGTSVARDFVEMPSQMMECWVWEKQALKQIARHYATGDAIPDELVDKMIAVQHLNSGLDALQQLLYSALDMRYHDGYLPSDDDDTTRVYHEIVREYSLLPVDERTCMQASFGHLVGYAAGYYGYTWAKVYALDMYSRFSEVGIYDPEVGRKYRDLILAKGNTVDPMTLIEEFLGRAPKIDAYLAFLGIEVTTG